ncbi:unnamed protein product [Lota lota]
MVSSCSSKMLEPSSPDHKCVSREDSCVSDPGSEAAVETDRFGFLLANGATAGSVGPPPELVRQREAKWIDIISQWDHVLQKKNSKVKEQCQKGIPASLRAKCWPLLCGATEHMKENKFLYKTLDSKPALQSWVDVIERDLDRQFPFHEMFVSKDGHGQRGLFRVLKAYTQYQPDEGYCQAQGPVAAVLLMNMPAEEAFWCLVQISEQYLPGYYSQLLEGVLFDAAMLSWVLKRTCLPAHRHLQRYGVEPLMFATDWLMCLFTRHLPFNTLLRVWDLFFCYGVRALFQVAVVLVRRVLGRAEQRQECSGQMETLERLRGVRESLGLEDDASFMAEVCSVPLSRSDLKRRTEKELENWRKARPSSTFDPRGRCHGYWASRETMREDRDRKVDSKGNLLVPLVRSASALSLSPSLFRRRWGKQSGAAKVERHHSMGMQGVGRESWEKARAPRVTHVEEGEDEHKMPGKLQSCMGTEMTQPTGVKRPLKMVRESWENQDSQRNALKVKGDLKEQEGIGHRTMEDQAEQRQMEDSQGGLGMVQEMIQHHSDINEGAVGVGATQSSAINEPLQPRTQEKDLKDNNQSQVPEEQDLKENNQSQVPEEQEPKDNNQSQVPEEHEPKDNNQSQVPEEQELEDNTQSQVPEEQDLKDINQSQVPEEQELEDNTQSQVPEEHEPKDNNQSQVWEEQELKDNNKSQVPEEQELEDNTQSQVWEEQELKDNNQSQVQEEQELKHNNQSQVPEEQELEDNTQSQVWEEQELKDNHQSQVLEEQELEDNTQSQVPEEHELKDNNQSQVPEEQELEDNTQSGVQEEQTCNSKQNQKEEVAEKHRVKTLYEIAKQAAHCKNLVASQVHMSETTADTNTDTEPQAVVATTEEQSDATPELETMTENGQPIAMHPDIGTTSECESVVQKSTTESTAQQGPEVMIQTDKGSQEIITDAEEGRTETEVWTTNIDSTQKQTNVGTENENDVDSGKMVSFKSEALKENTLPFQEVGVLLQKGVKQSGETREEGGFVVSTITAILVDTAVVTEASADMCETAKASYSDKACAEEDAICLGNTLEEKTVVDTNAETEEDNDSRTCNQTALIEVKQFNPRAPTDDKIGYSLTGDAEQLTTEEPAVQVSVHKMEERVENDKETVDSAEVIFNPNTSSQHPSEESGDRGTGPQIQDVHLPMVAGPAVVPCIPVSTQMVGHQSSTPSGDFRVRKSSSSHGSRFARRLSEDIFTAPQTSQIIPNRNPGRHKLTTVPSQPGLESTPPGALSNLPPSQGTPGSTEITDGTRGGASEGGLTTPEPPKRPGFFSRLRGGHPNHGKDRNAETTTTKKIQIPTIFLQDFSSGVGEERPLQEAEEQQEPLCSRERRRRRREREQKEREEEKVRRRVEKELKKEGKKKKDRKDLQRRKEECHGGEPSPRSVSGTHHSYSSPYTDSYF